MVIEVYSIDESPKFQLFRFESDCIPRENEIILYDNTNYIIFSVVHNVIREKMYNVNGKYMFTGKNSCFSIRLYVRKQENYDSNK